MRDRLAQLFRITPGQPALVMGVRGAIGIFTPIVVAQLAGQLPFGLLVAIGALNVLMADVGGPYRLRAKAMGTTGVAGTVAMLLGTLISPWPILSIPATFLWSLAAGMSSIYGNAATVTGLVINLVFVVAVGMGGGPADAVERASAFLLGGAFVMVYSLLLWPLHPYRPVTDAVASAYTALADFLAAEGETLASPPSSAALRPPAATATASGESSAVASPPSPTTAAKAAVDGRLEAAHQALDAVRAGASGASPTDAGLLVLLRAASRLALDGVALGKAFQTTSASPALPEFQPLLGTATAGLADATRQLASLVATGKGEVDLTTVDRTLAALDARARQAALDAGQPDRYRDVALAADARQVLATLADDLRGLADVARRLYQGLPPLTTVLPSGVPATPSTSWWDTLRSQLTFRSLAFRHALRLAVAASLGVLLYTALDLPHGFWVTLTTVAILKPNYGATLDTTLQRVGGTSLGAILAALLVAIAPSFLWLELAILPLTIVCFALKPLSYVLFVTLLTPLVVVLVDLGGSGDWMVAIRVANTVLGGALALGASYLLWPTWERDLLPRQLAATLRANRAYFRAVIATYQDQARDPPALAAARRQAVLENGNAAAAFQRMLGEPAGRRGSTRVWHELVTYNHYLLDSVSSLDVHTARYSGHHTLPGLGTFVQAAGDALEALAAAVAGGAAAGPLPPFDVALSQIRDRLTTLESTRTVELAERPDDTPTVEAVHDFYRLSLELDQIAREITGMKLALEGVWARGQPITQPA